MPRPDPQAGPDGDVAARGAVLLHLRSATREAHQALEGLSGLLDPQLDLVGYTEVLRRLHGFWIGWQPQMASLLDDALVRPRRRLHLLAADLTTLGLSDDDLRALPRCPGTAIAGRAEALGSLYVLEGSTLGGRLIGRNLQRCLGTACRQADTYFNGYGAQTGPMWRQFLDELDLVSPTDTDATARGATATFARLGWWLGRSSADRVFAP
jgi:heme oxygenase